MSLALVLAFAGYSVVTSAVAHSHEASGPHHVHFLDDHDSQHHEGTSANQQAVAGHDQDHQNAQDRSEPGFHSHSSPHFSPADKADPIDPFFKISLEKWGEPSGLSSLTKDGPPFKPPRTIL